MTDPVESIAVSLEAIDGRLAEIEKRFVWVEGHLADGARAADEHSKQLTKLADDYKSLAQSYKELANEYVEQGRRHEETNAIVQNYVTATIELRQEARSLISTVRASQPKGA